MLSRKARATAALRAEGPNPDITDQPTGRSLAVPNTTDRLNAGKPGFDARGWALDPRTMAREQSTGRYRRCRRSAPAAWIARRALSTKSGLVLPPRVRHGRFDLLLPVAGADQRDATSTLAPGRRQGAGGPKIWPVRRDGGGAARIPPASAIALALEYAAGKVVS